MLPLCLGARVMLLENLWQEAGLVNGALGCVADVAWLEGTNTRTEAAHVVFFEFDNYSGPPYFEGDEDRRCVVSIPRSVREFLVGVATCTRTQFPLTVAFAVTVHKRQGITPSCVVTDISERDFQPGLTYAAVSRATSLQGVMFDVPFDLEAIRKASRDSYIAREADARRREPQTFRPAELT